MATTTLLIAHILFVVICLFLILTRPHRAPEMRLAWIIVVMALPFLGAIAYLLVGHTSIGAARSARLRAVVDTLPHPFATTTPVKSAQAAALFRLGRSISGYRHVGGNRVAMMPNSEATIAAMISDIDAARDHVHLLFYIWLPDNSGQAVAHALQRAAARGVACRVLVDDVGSHALIQHPLWREMEQAGIQLVKALPVGNPLLRALTGRIDLRNHRKIVVIDNAITYCGSQNCADAAFLPKAKFAPWVDSVMRLEGPIALHNQHVFMTDWMGNGGDDIAFVLQHPPSLYATECGGNDSTDCIAQIVATGPTHRNGAMGEVFESFIYAAQSELIITTPYFVPTPSLKSALCAAGHRGVVVTLILPARNDDWVIAATCRSYYRELLESGIRIYEYSPGLLHAKTMVIDGNVALIGSGNMDQRSIFLNFENNIILSDGDACDKIIDKQIKFKAKSHEIRESDVKSWSFFNHLYYNAMAIFSPIF